MVVYSDLLIFVSYLAAECLSPVIESFLPFGKVVMGMWGGRKFNVIMSSVSLSKCWCMTGSPQLSTSPVFSMK